MVMSAIMHGAAALDAFTGHKASQFLIKNGGKLLGSAIHKTTKFVNKPEWGDKLARGVDKATNVAQQVLGQDNELTKNLTKASEELKGNDTSWRSIKDDNTTALAIPQNPVNGYYHKNLGGSNFKRYTSKHSKFGRVKVQKSKFMKKKPNKFGILMNNK